MFLYCGCVVLPARVQLEWILTLIDIGALSWNNKNTRNQKCTVKTSKKKNQKVYSFVAYSWSDFAVRYFILLLSTSEAPGSIFSLMFAYQTQMYLRNPFFPTTMLGHSVSGFRYFEETLCLDHQGPRSSGHLKMKA